jgi:CYTH domain-containing protein
VNQEIERKFIVNPKNKTLIKLLAGHSYKLENRYYLYRAEGIEQRFTLVIPDNGDTYYDFDRMQVVGESHAIRSKERLKITKEEFNSLLALLKLRELHVQPIIKKSYLISENPQTEIKVYGGKYDGLIRAEVEFASQAKAVKYKPEDWFGKELTDSPLGNDVKLPDLSRIKFSQILENYLNT